MSREWGAEMAATTLVRVTDAPGLWSALLSQGGLHPVRRADGAENYDTALEAAVREELCLGPGGMVGAIRASGVSMEALLGAILLGFRPWAAMLQEILQMLEAAGAGHAGQTMELKVQWHRLSPQLRAQLWQFRRWTEQAQKAVALAGGPMWGELNLCDPRLRWSPDVDWDRLPPEFRNWRDAYKGGARFDPPRPPRTGHAAFDREVLRLHAAVRSHLRAVRAMGGSTNERYHLAERQRAAGEQPSLGEGWTAQGIVEVDHDHLADGALLAAVAAPGSDAWDGTAADAYALDLRSALDEVSVQETPTLSATKALSDLLDLPAWRKRHELYSVWIAAVIREASPQPWRWLTRDRALSFAFAGSQVATLNLPPYEGVFWAELSRKATLTRSVVRKNTVKPDYTLLLAQDRHRAMAGLVVECKQYRKPSRRNFDAALTDYAEAHPFAPVVLANYGRIGPTSADLLSAGRCAPVAAFGEVFPAGEGLAPFLAFLRSAFAALPHLAENLRQEKRAFEVAAVDLAWTSGGDLDLHVAARDVRWPRTRVGYGAPPDPEAQATMRWSGDEVLPPAMEAVEISLPLSGPYEIYVNRYDGLWPEGEDAVVTVRYGQLEAQLVRPDGQGDWWHVGSLFPEERTLRAGGMLAQAPW